jgi:hypothetical protein
MPSKMSVKEYVTYKLESPNANLGADRRFYYTLDRKRWWKVDYWNRWKTGEGDACKHVQAAIEFIDACGGWRTLPTWNQDVRPKKEVE